MRTRRGAACRTKAALLLGALTVACAGDGTGGDVGTGAGPASGRLRVVASFYPLAEAARRVGGGRVQVTTLTAPGVEPHDLELTPAQVDRLEDADVVLHVGSGFQPAVERSVARRRGVAVDVLEAVVERVPDEGGPDGADPHFWLDPLRMSAAADVVAAALARRSPGDRAAFEAGADRFRRELAALHREFEAGLADCRRREIVTSHAAFHFLAERYGLTQLALAGVSPEAEPDAARLAELADRVRSTGATTVFHEPLVSAEVAEALAREAGVETAVLDPLEGLTEDQLAAGKDYDGVMRENLEALERALECR